MGSFREFYPFYLSEHRNQVCRRLHFVGSILGLGAVGVAIATWDWRFALLGFLLGYSCAWIGHFFFEKNNPATFRHPFYSFVGDWIMFKDMLTGRVKF